MKIADTVRSLAEPVIERLNAGIELLEAEYVKEGSDWYLRLYIDKQGGITLDDCQLVSEALNDLLDEADVIKGKYLFEVSSPGLDRPLKTDRDFERYQGEDVEVHLMRGPTAANFYREIKGTGKRGNRHSGKWQRAAISGEGRIAR